MKTIKYFGVITILVLLITAMPTMSASAVDPEKTITVNFTGVTVGNVWIRQAGTSTDVITPLGPKTDSATAGVPYGTYDVWVQQGSGVYEKKLNVDCSAGGACTAAYSIANLTVNFSGVTVGNVLVRVPGSNSDVIPWSGAKTGSYGPVNLLADKYDIWAQQGSGKWEIISNFDCSGGGTCTAAYSIANLTVNFSGVTVGNVLVRVPGTNSDVIAWSGNKTDSYGPVNLLADKYDIWAQQGNGKWEIISNFDCSAGGAFTAAYSIANLTVNFTGVTVGNVWIRQSGGTNNDVVTPLGSKTDSAGPVNLLADYYDVWVQQGGGAYEKKLNVDCTAIGPCTANYVVATLTVPFAGFSGVDVWVRVPDEPACSANGGTAIQASGQTDQAVFKVLQDYYDVIMQVSGKYYTYDKIDCTGDTCTAKPTLTVNFKDLSGIHTYIKKSDSVAGKATGADVANQTYKDNQAVFTTLAPGKYDVVVVQGAMNKVIDDVMVFGSCASVDNIVVTLTVKFPDISSVHTYVKTLSGGDVDNRTYKDGSASLVVLKSTYKVVVVKGAQQNTYELDCSAGDCTLEGIVATMLVKFPDLSSVHTYVKTLSGGDVDNRTYQNNSASLAVLKSTYKVVVVKGAQQNTYELDCSAGDCTLEGIVATMLVKFPDISSVHTYVKTLSGGDVDNRTYQINSASLAVLEGNYLVVVVKGAKQKTVEPVDCTDIGTCTVDNIVATLTIQFPGLTSVHAYVKLVDDKPGEATGGDVDNRTYQSNSTSLVVLKSFYDVLIVKGSESFVYDNVDCTGATCTLHIAKALSTTVVTFEADPYVYRGTAFTATAVVTGVGGLNQPVAVVYSGDCTNATVANGCTATATFDGDQNHDGSTDSKSVTITKASSATVVTFEAGSYVYRDTAFTATAVVTGVGGLNQPVAVVYSGDCTNVTVANGCTATATFDGDQNHDGSTDSKSVTIAKANATCTVTGYSVYFDNNFHTAIGSCTGVLGESLSGLDLSGTTHKLVGSFNDAWTFTDGTGNYNNASGRVIDTISAWTLKGFYQPVDMNGVYNGVKNGSTVPLKFEIFAGATEFTDVSAFKSLTYAETGCSVTAIVGDIDETVATGGTVLRYDTTGSQFIYNWKTPSTAGKCYRVTMTTQDGSSLVAYFKLK